jgi:hypothetical protein
MIRSRLQRLKHKDTRKLIVTIMAGKMIGLMTVIGLMKGVAWYFESSAHAAPLVRQAAVNTDQLVSAANTVWVLITGLLHAGRVHGPRSGVRPLT